MTDASQVAAAVQRVKVVTPSIWGLVNNVRCASCAPQAQARPCNTRTAQAGISGGVEAQFTDVSVTERVMRVNYFGSIRVALGFLPLLVRRTALSAPPPTCRRKTLTSRARSASTWQVARDPDRLCSRQVQSWRRVHLRLLQGRHHELDGYVWRRAKHLGH